MALPRPAILGALLFQAGLELAWAGEEDIECGTLAEAANLTELKGLLMAGPSNIFMDVDEVMLMPDTPFVGELPGTEAFINTLKQPGSGCTLNPRHWPRMFHMFDDARKSAPFKLVDAGFPDLIRELRDSEKRVLAIVQRDMNWRNTPSFSSELFMHSHTMVEALVTFGIRFDPLPKRAKKLGNTTKAGGMLMGGMTARGRDLAKIIADVMPTNTEAKAVFVHSNSRRVRGALEARGDSCLVGVHFVGARDSEQGDAERVKFFCDAVKKLKPPPADCDLCPEEVVEL